MKISENLKENVNIIKQKYNKDFAVKYRSFSNLGRKYTLIFIDGMVNSAFISDNIIRPIIRNKKLISPINPDKSLLKKVLIANDIKTFSDMEKCIDDLPYGNSILFIDGCNKALSFDTKEFTIRSVDEPENEKAANGPREGFCENILTNVSLLRRKILNPDLKFVNKTLGTRTKTKIVISYIEGIVDKKVLKEVEERIDKIKIDSILDVNYIREIITNHKRSPFKTAGTFEKPDTIAGKILEGRIAIFVDGSPMVMTVPYLFIENFQTSDDYYLNYYYASIGRVIRVISYYLTLSICAIYVAMTSFHKELLPTNLAISITASREGMPMSTAMECILMILVFEFLRESGARMTTSASPALGIVGGLVIGQSAVEARLVSAPMIIIVAMSAITELMIPRLKSTTIIFRFSLIILASLFGFYGYFFGMLLLVIYICSLDSFGMSYTADIIGNPLMYKDSYLRFPWFKIRTRPIDMSKNKVREDINEKDIS